MRKGHRLLLAGGPCGFSRLIARGLGHFLWKALGRPLSPAGGGLSVWQSWCVPPARSMDGEHAGGLESLTHMGRPSTSSRHTQKLEGTGGWPVIFPGEQMYSSEAHVHGTREHHQPSSLAYPECHPFSGGRQQACHPDPGHRSLGGSCGPPLDLEGRGDMCA